jgi:hypothetical protein
MTSLECKNSSRSSPRSDASLNKVAASVIRGQHAWLEEGRMPLGLTADSFRTKFLTAREEKAGAPRQQAAAS